MAAPDGGTSAGVVDRLLADAPRYEFFQAVRLLQLAERRRPVGHDADPGQEAVRFSSSLSLAFPTSDLASLERDQDPARPPRMCVSFLGAATPASFGSLPLPYSQAMRDQIRGRQGAAASEFVDLFNHRLIALFYRAWEKYRFAIVYERDASMGTFERALLALIGLTRETAERLPIDGRVVLHGAASLGRRPVSACALESLLSEYLGLKIEVVAFEGAWHAIGESELVRLGQRGKLGEDTFIGTRVLLAQHRFRIRVGPMGRDRFEDLLPACHGLSPRAAGRGLRSMAALTKLAVGMELEFDVELLLVAEEVPGLRLAGSRASAEPESRLGWTTWLRSPGRTCTTGTVTIASSGVDRPDPTVNGTPPTRETLG